jgi:hypothetical protein
MKKYFIRKTQQETLAEQNSLLRRLLSQHETATIQAASRIPQEVPYYPNIPNIETETTYESFDFDDADDVFIPKVSKNDTAQLKVSSTKVDLDMGNVDKLKKKKSSLKKEKR